MHLIDHCCGQFLSQKSKNSTRNFIGNLEKSKSKCKIFLCILGIWKMWDFYEEIQICYFINQIFNKLETFQICRHLLFIYKFRIKIKNKVFKITMKFTIL